jgi:hypothetical protein
MSVSVPPPLPPVVKPFVDDVVIEVADAINSIPIQPYVQKIDAPTLILISKDLADEDLAIFQEFGKVVQWKETFVNLPFAQLQKCDYLVVDCRLKSARLSLAKEDLSKYNVVHYTTWLQKAEDIVKQVPGAVITSVPSRCTNKDDFDCQLLTPKLVSPSLIKSFLRLVIGCFTK